MPNKLLKLFTIGFTKWSAEDFFTKLQSAGVRRVVDTRLNTATSLRASAVAATSSTSCGRSPALTTSMTLTWPQQQRS